MQEQPVTTWADRLKYGPLDGPDHAAIPKHCEDADEPVARIRGATARLVLGIWVQSGSMRRSGPRVRNDSANGKWSRQPFTHDGGSCCSASDTELLQDVMHVVLGCCWLNAQPRGDLLV